MEGPTIRLRDGETAVVGYGSLLSRASVGRTLGREYDGPFVACRVAGWRRAWDVSMPNRAYYYEDDRERVYPGRILYLNARPEPEALMNCVLFVVRPGELEAMHHREWIYDPVVVTADLRGVRLEGGDAILYVARREHIVHDAREPHEAAVRASYVRLLERALAGVDDAFRAEYERTTDPVPADLVVEDTLDPDRPSPWASAGHDYTPETEGGG